MSCCKWGGMGIRAAMSMVGWLILAVTTSGCGVRYTVWKSEAKLDRLSVPMNKLQVLERIGHPDRMSRDDGRMVIWEYSLTARKQWL